MTYAEIGAQTGLAPSSVGDLAQGRTFAPIGDAAVILYKLHAERCLSSGNAKEELIFGPAPAKEGEAADAA